MALIGTPGSGAQNNPLNAGGDCSAPSATTQKKTYPQMTQMAADKKKNMIHLRHNPCNAFLICGHLRHLRIILSSSNHPRTIRYYRTLFIASPNAEFSPSSPATTPS